MTDVAPVTESQKQTKTEILPVQAASLSINKSMQLFESLGKSNSVVMKNSLDIMQETLAFSQARLLENVEAWKSLITCKNLSDLSALQAEFTKKATTHYTDAASNLASRMVSVLADAAAPVREQLPKS